METKNAKKFQKKIQLVTADLKGRILFTDDHLFRWKEGSEIYEAHPFFEIIKDLLGTYEVSNNEFSFPCVHLGSDDDNIKICDITIIIELTEINIVIFDYTKAYLELNEISQQRNESIIRNQELEFSNRLLIEKEAFKDNFIENINHEVTTPLTSIKGFLELLDKTELTYEQEGIINVLKAESDHLQNIFSDMLDLSKIQRGVFKLSNESFDLGNLLNAICESYKVISKEKALKFNVFIDSKLNTDLVGDKTRIYQVITNLLNNAIRYTDGGFINLSVKKLGGKNRKQKIEIIVEDSGTGISEEDIVSIFDQFTQFGENTEGSGLGLHIVRSLVHLMKGQIQVESEVGKGTKFTINLSLKNQSDEGVSSIGKIKAKLPTGKKYRILVVENKLNTQYLIMRQLLNQGCFFVDVVNTGEDAIKTIERRNYDLMILDIKLPKMSGFDLADRIRNTYGDVAIQQLPILGVSAMSSANVRNLCVTHGIDSFLSKPFTEEALIGKIVRLINRKSK